MVLLSLVRLQLLLLVVLPLLLLQLVPLVMLRLANPICILFLHHTAPRHSCWWGKRVYCQL